MNDYTLDDISILLQLVRRELRSVDPMDNNERVALRDLAQKLVRECARTQL